jgi:hypothetical protein
MTTSLTCLPDVMTSVNSFGGALDLRAVLPSCLLAGMMAVALRKVLSGSTVARKVNQFK